VCRWGGDEIAVFFSSSADALKLCSDILNSVHSIKFDFDGTVTYITVSIGLITFSSETAFNLSDLITAADSNLYFSKSSGRNRISVTAFPHNLDPQGGEIGNCS